MTDETAAPPVAADEDAVSPVVADDAAAPPAVFDRAAASPGVADEAAAYCSRKWRRNRRKASSTLQGLKAVAELAPVREPRESAPEPSLVQEPTESAPEPAPAWELTKSTPEPAPVRKSSESAPESAPEPAPVREPTESAPESIPEPAPVREPTDSAPVREPTESAPVRTHKVRSGSSQSPLRSGSPQSPPQSGSSQSPLHSLLRSRSPQNPLKNPLLSSGGCLLHAAGPTLASCSHPCLPIPPGPLPIHRPGPPSLHQIRLQPTPLLFSILVCGASGIRSLKGGWVCVTVLPMCPGATRCLCMLSTWLVVCCWCHVLSCLLSVPSHFV